MRPVGPGAAVASRSTPLVGLVSRLAGDVMIDGLRTDASTFERGLGPGTVIATEEQDLVYRSGPPAGDATAPRRPVPEEDDGPWRIQIVPDPVLLFRVSALTYNAHRIHYDADYATTVEGHPGLVVHGPSIASPPICWTSLM